ncbi:hypothetical protein [Nitrosovibrio sp. Nv4]|nr:hypothetical protein [Nitrosovibrio sp. Nv4]
MTPAKSARIDEMEEDESWGAEWCRIHDYVTGAGADTIAHSSSITSF